MHPTPPPAADMTMMNNAAAAPPLDPQEIAAETGYSPEKVAADIERTQAHTKSELYPNFYGEGQGGIEPDVAATAGGYQEPVPMNEPQPVDEMDTPTRSAARAQMMGPGMPTPMPAAQEEMEEPAVLGSMARRPNGNLRERARKMNVRY